MRMTCHAATRAQQRAIPKLVIDWLAQYGATQHDHRGATVRYLDKRSRSQILESHGARLLRKYERKLGAYMVVAGDIVITVGHRTDRIRR